MLDNQGMIYTVEDSKISWFSSVGFALKLTFYCMLETSMSLWQACYNI
jgi:hypothetical protein